MNNQEFNLLDKLYDTYSKSLYSFALHKLQNDDKANEAVQMVFLIAAKKIGVLSEHENKKLWLYQTMNNVTKQILFNKKYTKDNQLREILTDDIKESAYTDQYEFEDIGVLDELKGVLKEREYKYLIERFVNDKSNQEIADILGISYAAATSFGNRVLKKAKKYIENREKY